MSVFVCFCVRACLCLCVSVCACACARVCPSVAYKNKNKHLFLFGHVSQSSSTPAAIHIHLHSTQTHARARAHSHTHTHKHTHTYTHTHVYTRPHKTQSIACLHNFNTFELEHEWFSKPQSCVSRYPTDANDQKRTHKHIVDFPCFCYILFTFLQLQEFKLSPSYSLIFACGHCKSLCVYVFMYACSFVPRMFVVYACLCVYSKFVVCTRTHSHTLSCLLSVSPSHSLSLTHRELERQAYTLGGLSKTGSRIVYMHISNLLFDFPVCAHCAYIHVYVHMCVYSYAHAREHTHTHTHTHTLTHIHTHTHTSTNTHTRILSLSLSPSLSLSFVRALSPSPTSARARACARAWDVMTYFMYRFIQECVSSVSIVSPWRKVSSRYFNDTGYKHTNSLNCNLPHAYVTWLIHMRCSGFGLTSNPWLMGVYLLVRLCTSNYEPIIIDFFRSWCI